MFIIIRKTRIEAAATVFRLFPKERDVQDQIDYEKYDADLAKAFLRKSAKSAGKLFILVSRRSRRSSQIEKLCTLSSGSDPWNLTKASRPL